MQKSMVEAVRLGVVQLVPCCEVFAQRGEETAIEDVARNRNPFSTQDPGDRLPIARRLENVPCSSAHAEAKGLAYPHACSQGAIHILFLHEAALEKKFMPQLATPHYHMSTAPRCGGASHIATPTIRHVHGEDRIVWRCGDYALPFVLTSRLKYVAKAVAILHLTMRKDGAWLGAFGNKL
jgi:hypothetical protein